MTSVKGESFVLVRNSTGRVAYRYEIPSHLERYSLSAAQNGVLIAGEGTPIFGFDGRSVRRLETPSNSRVIEGSSLRVPMVAVGDRVVHVALGEEMPGCPVRGLWIEPRTLILRHRTYVITIAVSVLSFGALLVLVIRRFFARKRPTASMHS